MQKLQQWQETTQEYRTDVMPRESTAREGTVRPVVKALIHRNIKEHADTWRELAKH